MRCSIRAATGWIALAALLEAAPASASPVISEVLYDAVGSDDGQVFVELYGEAGFSLDGLQLVGRNGSDGSVTIVLDLMGQIPADGVFVVADGRDGSTRVPQADQILSFDLQNGPDSLQLLDAAGDLIDALGYGDFGEDEVFAGEGRAAPDPPAGRSLARVFADVDRDDNALDFAALEQPTPGIAPLAVPEPSQTPLLWIGLTWLAAWRLRKREP